jgi:hypothetical protein
MRVKITLIIFPHNLSTPVPKSLSLDSQAISMYVVAGLMKPEKQLRSKCVGEKSVKYDLSFYKVRITSISQRSFADVQ